MRPFLRVMNNWSTQSHITLHWQAIHVVQPLCSFRKNPCFRRRAFAVARLLLSRCILSGNFWTWRVAPMSGLGSRLHNPTSIRKVSAAPEYWIIKRHRWPGFCGRCCISSAQPFASIARLSRIFRLSASDGWLIWLFFQLGHLILQWQPPPAPLPALLAIEGFTSQRTFFTGRWMCFGDFSRRSRRR